MKLALVVLIAILTCDGRSAQYAAREIPGDPCLGQLSNAEEGLCYGKAQARANAKADRFAKQIAYGFLREAQKPDTGDVISSILRKASRAVEQSQRHWKAYRDQHCNAVMYSYTTGSGAGPAYERCMFELGQLRVRELIDAFGPPSSK